MSVGRKPNLPISKTWVQTGKEGNTYIADVSITQTSDSKKYPPDGIKAVFKAFALDDKGTELSLYESITMNHMGFITTPTFQAKNCENQFVPKIIRKLGLFSKKY